MNKLIDGWMNEQISGLLEITVKHTNEVSSNMLKVRLTSP